MAEISILLSASEARRLAELANSYKKMEKINEMIQLAAKSGQYKITVPKAEWVEHAWEFLRGAGYNLEFVDAEEAPQYYVISWEEEYKPCLYKGN